MKKIVLLLSFSALAAQGKNLSFIDKDLDTFVKRMLPEHQQNKFVSYYNSYTHKLAALEDGEQQKKKLSIAKKAQKELIADHQAWAQEISDFLLDIAHLDKSYESDRANLQAFLERYGVYKEFVEGSHPKSMQVAQQTRARKIWNDVKSGVSKAGRKVGTWFKNVKSHVMA